MMNNKREMSQILTVKNPCFFVNTELKIPYQQILLPHFHEHIFNIT